MRENKNIGSELDTTALRIRGGGRRLVAAVIIDIIAALAVIVFGVLLWSSGLLPLKFFIPLCIILLLLCGVLTILSLGGRHLLRPTLGMIFNLLLALACVLGSYMVTKGVDTLRDIIGKRESSNHVGIYVRTDDPARTCRTSRAMHSAYSAMRTAKTPIRRSPSLKKLSATAKRSAIQSTRTNSRW